MARNTAEIDRARVFALEGVATTQHAATVPWQPVTDYAREARRTVEGQHPALIARVFTPTRVLDVGCGPGHLLAFLQELGVPGDGLDVQRPTDPPFVFFHQSILDSVASIGQYDLVICREVLEHLTIYQIVRAVRHLVQLSSRYLYVTTRFVHRPTHLLDVGTDLETDPTHITCLTKSFLRLLFVLEGCRSRPDLEQQLDWQHKDRCLVFTVPS